MSAEEHKARAPSTLKLAWITVSDTRTPESDSAGQLAHGLIREAGHTLADYRVVRDDAPAVAEAVRAIVAAGTCDAVITSGGTGISRRDTTFEAVAGLLDKRLDGFGELFRMLSYADVGSAAMLSRAVAGLVGGVPVFALPGSRGAVKLALEKLILPELGHLAAEARK